jgi:DNA polymerase-3 subunit alpha
MYFGTFLDRAGQFLDTVHFPPVAKRYPFRGQGIYTLKGKVAEEFGFYSIEVEEMERLPYIDDPRYTDIPLRAGERSIKN